MAAISFRRSGVRFLARAVPEHRRCPAVGQEREYRSEAQRQRKHGAVEPQGHRHLDYGYSSTSHASQSRSVERAAVQVDTGDYRLHKLLNRTFSYVAGSRPEYALASSPTTRKTW
jgi:hypothetical protein